MKVILYTKPYCGQCKYIAGAMDKKHIKYEKIDDEEITLKVGGDNNISSVPFAQIDNKFLTTVQLVNWINEQN